MMGISGNSWHSWGALGILLGRGADIGEVPTNDLYSTPLLTVELGLFLNGRLEIGALLP